MTIELVVDDCTHDIDIHFCSRCDARDLSANLRPMKCLAGVAARSRPGNEPLRFIICRPFIASDECARILLPSPPDHAPLCCPSLQCPQQHHALPFCAAEPRHGMDARRLKTRLAGLQLRRQPGPDRETPPLERFFYLA
jgi:hypothetical protein